MHRNLRVRVPATGGPRALQATRSRLGSPKGLWGLSALGSPLGSLRGCQGNPYKQWELTAENSLVLGGRVGLKASVGPLISGESVKHKSPSSTRDT